MSVMREKESMGVITFRDKLRRVSGFDRHPLIITSIFVLAILIILILLSDSFEKGVFILLFYLYGSIPFGYIFLYLNAREEIPEDRGIIGVAKSFRLGGYRSGVPTAAGEISKALLPLVFSYVMYDLDVAITVSLVFASYIGTNFSIFLGGRGGAGATIILWSTLVLSPLTLLIDVVIFIISLRISRNTYFSSMLFFLLLPLLIALIERSPELTLFGIGVAAVFITRFSRERDEMKNLRMDHS
jgi:glycerol-3-phosphate acyltransferase PlsY